MKEINSGFFVSGTDTNIGKTVVSACLAYKLNGEYWKPIQCGYNNKGETDSDVVKRITDGNIKVHQENYLLKNPISPNLAAIKEGISINVKDIKLPKNNLQNNIIVEGAGGLLVPIDNKYFVIDLIKKLSLPLILVSSTKLGTINHTLLSISEIIKKDVDFRGIIFTGEILKDVINTIEEFAKKIYVLKSKKIVLGCLPKVEKIDFETIKKFESLIEI